MSTTCASSLRLEQGLKHVITLIMVTVLLLDMHRCKMTALCAEIPKREITCSAGTFNARENASVSCNFPTDVAIDGNDVLVERLPVNASKDAIWLDTLACRWKDSKQPYECDVTEGFSFDGVISDHLTLQIPDVDHNEAGTYICYIVSSNIPSTECELTVTEARLSSPETTTRNATSSPSIEKDTGINVVLISILSVALLILLAGLVVILLKRHLKK
ncbi:uncharacterized protein [Littorina saxatilis]|uniref:uncharacterized protein n=1 Tax=Littorina saxatilis TaxID=31220 RepID=UPI0038B560B0